jgi:putative redox protein
VWRLHLIEALRGSGSSTHRIFRTTGILPIIQQERIMKATVTLEQGMAFTGTANIGYTIQMDASPSVGGDDSGFRPMELLLIGLGGCTAMDVISILRKKRQDITSFEVKLDADQAGEHPRVFTDITITYLIRGRNVNSKAVARAIELSETRYCPAQAMLVQAANITHAFEITEEAS